MKQAVVLFWFRRDLRLQDNAGLHHALASGQPVLPLFIFDPQILEQFEDKKDRRVHYIHQVLENINAELGAQGASLNTYFDSPLEVFQKLASDYAIQGVYCNRDYEPAAIARDKVVYDYFTSRNIPFRAFKDQVIFDKKDIVKKDQLPYTVYTPYAKAWKAKLAQEPAVEFPTNNGQFLAQPSRAIHSLDSIGFSPTDTQFSPPQLNTERIATYDQYRDFPALNRTTHLGIALRFGTISVRHCVRYAAQHNAVWLSELIWREFFMQILYHFPHVVDRSFKAKYDNIQWRNNEDEFARWCQGQTGYPIVDAGMRELNQTGFMHNRVRMIVASFLCKHLLIDWRWGEAYFAQKLNDYDLSANNGNWQWAAGCGCDAAPYFRVFSPELQTAKFDKEHRYIQKWVPEYQSSHYVEPIVAHAFARERALATYGKALKEVN